MENPKIQNKITFKDFQVLELNYKLRYNEADIDNNKNNEDKIKIGHSVQFGIGNNQTLYAVLFKADIVNEDFILDLQIAMVFECETEIDDEFKESSFVKNSSPAIAFPYLRTFIANFTLNSGVKPFHLPTFNFSQPKIEEKKADKPKKKKASKV